MSRTLVAITAGLSTPSTSRQISDTIVDAVTSAVTARGEGLDVTTIEVRELINDLAQVFTTGIPSPRLDEVKRTISDADGVVVVTPIFKANYSGLLKMFFDALDQDALNGMPTIIAATAGTARHSLATEYGLRPLLTYMRAVVVPTSLFAATDDFGGAEGAEFEHRVARAAGELATLMVDAGSYSPGFGGATVEAERRPRRSGVDLDEPVTSFADLLKHYGG
ncbi:FMN reductase [Corynebacterium uterequi]|uniref:LLM-partnered FMN reductase, CE1759 family n=1 Tax=Corynebacterium uterequi TaxID=1072256 RepID=A0A0G3HES3_9CORY|nr:FMN reductase [Corynebacterium uterequi]AKK11220.1 LLM-partnered FMN reductase, CE1759 family [Corynebacterium uterequi]